MFLNLKKPLVFFDLETTGTSIVHDRIVEYAMVKVHPDGRQEKKVQRLNPGKPIPKEVTLVHGITDEDVKDQPRFKEVAVELDQFLRGCDMAGFNIVKFDVPILAEEFLRADVKFELGNRCLLDAQKIFHTMEKRNLAAAFQFYCDKQLEGAHSAEADTLATVEILNAQFEKYDGEEMTDLLGNLIGTFCNDVRAMHDLTNAKQVDLAGRIKLNQQGEAVFNFGKYRDRPVQQVFAKEPTYYDWIMKGDFPLDTKRRFTEIKLKGFSS